MQIDWTVAAKYPAVLLIALGVAIAELLSRYHDDRPFRIILSPPGLFYLAVNTGAAVFALYVVSDSPTTRITSLSTLYQVLLAGFGAIAFFRTSFFTARIGTTDVPIGPAGFLQSILATIDRYIDRTQAERRAKTVSEVMQNVDFEKARSALPIFCFGLMQLVTEEEQNAVADGVKNLVGAQIDPAIKSRSLGLVLIKVVGDKVLREAVTSLGETILTRSDRVGP